MPSWPYIHLLPDLLAVTRGMEAIIMITWSRYAASPTMLQQASGPIRQEDRPQGRLTTDGEGAWSPNLRIVTAVPLRGTRRPPAM